MTPSGRDRLDSLSLHGVEPKSFEDSGNLSRQPGHSLLSAVFLTCDYEGAAIQGRVLACYVCPTGSFQVFLTDNSHIHTISGERPIARTIHGEYPWGMDLSFRVDAMQADGQWYGIVRMAQVEIWRTPEGYDTRGKAEVGAKITFAEALAVLVGQAALQAG